MPRAPDPDALLPLTPAVLHILLALAGAGRGGRHGYAVAQDVETLTEGAVRMGPGTLYGSLQRMLAAGLIDETAADDAGRRYYRTTAFGDRVLARELARLDRVVTHARARRLLPPAEAT